MTSIFFKQKLTCRNTTYKRLTNICHGIEFGLINSIKTNQAMGTME